MDTAQEIQTTATIVPDRKRSRVVGEKFGSYFPMKIEPTIYDTLARQVSEYNGGLWKFYTLSNGGFYMSPSINGPVTMNSDNQSSESVSVDAAGIVACLYTFSILSFSANEIMAKLCAAHYHLLREYIFDHEEVSKILTLID